MDIEIRTISEEEFAGYARAVELAFSDVISDEDVERERALAEYDRTYAALDGPDIVGSTAVFTMPMTVPGGEIEIGYVTAVGVRATHRRRGINTDLMRRQLDDAHERGELVDVLYASEGGIYGRYGYGLATLGLTFEIERSRTGFVPGYAPSGEVRMVERDPALKDILAVLDAARRSRPGMVQLDERRLRYALHDHGPDAALPQLFVLHAGDDGVDGFAIYRVKHDWPAGFPQSVLTVLDLQATSPGAYADLWRYVFEVDLIERVAAGRRPVDEPLLHLLQEPRRLGARLGDNLWVRPVDVVGALAARRYASDGRVVIDVVDPFCPWNEGRSAVEVADGRATVTVGSSGPSDLTCSVNEIGAAYLGGTSFRQLHRAGRVDEHADGALARADAMFGWDPAPWCPYVF